MTSRERRAARRKRDRAAAGLTTAYRAPVAFHGRLDAQHAIATNQNSGKRHASSGAAARELTASERIRAAREQYVPLTVHTPIRRARKAPRTTSYTI